MVDLIRNNIIHHGFHVYEILAGPTPPWIYSIGLSEKIGFELILAGGLLCTQEDRASIFDEFSNACLSGGGGGFQFRGEEFNSVLIGEEWPDELFLGAIDYYGCRPKYRQICLPLNLTSLDVPDMSVAWSTKEFPIWRWLVESWSYQVPPHCVVLVDTDILCGFAAAEVAYRFSEDSWEIYSRQPDEISEEHKRIIPLGVLMGIDPGLEDVVNLQVGDAIERDSSVGDWRPWC